MLPLNILVNSYNRNNKYVNTSFISIKIEKMKTNY